MEYRSRDNLEPSPFNHSTVNKAYDPEKDRIELRYKEGSLRDIAEASDNLGIQALARPVEKWYLAWPRWLS